MTLLVILWPDAPDSAARALADSAARALPDGGGPADQPLDYVLSHDGLAPVQQGRAAAAQLPRADTIVAVLPAAALSWHRIRLPKAPSGRLRAALGGMLEERLLEDDADTHLAVAPGARAGEPGWVAALAKPALAARLAAWSAAGLHVDRVVAALAPGGEASAHVYAADAGAEPPRLWLALADSEGACAVPLDGGLARARLAEAQARTEVRVTATPAAAAAAERWLGAPVTVQPEAEHALAAARSGWELRQFDLAPSLRGTRTLGRVARQLMGPSWRWARYGLAAAIAFQLIGLNLTAWQQQRLIEQRQLALVDLLRASHPQVRAVLDAPVQMRRETERLRMVAGVPGDADLETLVAAAARAWPPGLAPTTSLRYESGRLTLAAAGWLPAQMAQFRQRLSGSGWQADFADGQLVISKAEAPAATPPAGLAPLAPGKGNS